MKWWHYDPTKWMIRLCSLIGLTKDLKRCTLAQIEEAKLNMQYQLATERCELLNIPENWRLRLEQEYEQFLQTLQLWSNHRQAWYEAKEKKFQRSLENWDQLQIRDKYKEVHYSLKVQKRRWEKMLRNLSEPFPVPA